MSWPETWRNVRSCGSLARQLADRVRIAETLAKDAAPQACGLGTRRRITSRGEQTLDARVRRQAGLVQVRISAIDDPVASARRAQHRVSLEHAERSVGRGYAIRLTNSFAPRRPSHDHGRCISQPSWLQDQGRLFGMPQRAACGRKPSAGTRSHMTVGCPVATRYRGQFTRRSCRSPHRCFIGGETAPPAAQPYGKERVTA